MGLFSRKPPSVTDRLADAVAIDAAESFARFVAARPDDTPVGLALCSVDDAASPYIMGATLKNIVPGDGDEDKSWRADPADWAWSDPFNGQRYHDVIGEILEDQTRPFGERANDIFQGIVDGLQKFDATGKFKSKVAREQMLLVLWINDPSDSNAEAVMKWVKQLNPESVSAWFDEVYTYRAE